MITLFQSLKELNIFATERISNVAIVSSEYWKEYLVKLWMISLVPSLVCLNCYVFTGV